MPGQFELISLIGTMLGALAASFYLSLRRVASMSSRADQSLDRKVAAVLKTTNDLEARLAVEIDNRLAAEAHLNDMSKQRERDIERNARELADLNNTLSAQRARIDSLNAKVAQLEIERDELRRQRDEARSREATLSATLDSTAQRLNKAEAEISAMQVENKAFELIFSRFNISISENKDKPNA